MRLEGAQHERPSGTGDREHPVHGRGGPGSLDGQNGLIFCDSSSGALIGDDDPGFVPATGDIFKCEVTVAKALVKLVAAGRSVTTT